jgi:hypothetical protein
MLARWLDWFCQTNFQVRQFCASAGTRQDRLAKQTPRKTLRGRRLDRLTRIVLKLAEDFCHGELVGFLGAAARMSEVIGDEVVVAAVGDDGVGECLPYSREVMWVRRVER